MTGFTFEFCYFKISLRSRGTTHDALIQIIKLSYLDRWHTLTAVKHPLITMALRLWKVIEIFVLSDNRCDITMQTFCDIVQQFIFKSFN